MINNEYKKFVRIDKNR